MRAVGERAQPRRGSMRAVGERAQPRRGARCEPKARVMSVRATTTSAMPTGISRRSGTRAASSESQSLKERCLRSPPASGAPFQKTGSASASRRTMGTGATFSGGAHAARVRDRHAPQRLTVEHVEDLRRNARPRAGQARRAGARGSRADRAAAPRASRSSSRARPRAPGARARDRRGPRPSAVAAIAQVALAARARVVPAPRLEPREVEVGRDAVLHAPEPEHAARAVTVGVDEHRARNGRGDRDLELADLERRRSRCGSAPAPPARAPAGTGRSGGTTTAAGAGATATGAAGARRRPLVARVHGPRQGEEHHRRPT